MSVSVPLYTQIVGICEQNKLNVDQFATCIRLEHLWTKYPGDIWVFIFQNIDTNVKPDILIEWQITQNIFIKLT